MGSRPDENIGGVTPNPDVVAKRLDNEMVLVHLKTNRIFTLNPTGARFWELLSEGLPRDAIRDRLHEEYDADDVDLDAEIDALLASLVAEDLLRVV